MSSADQHGDNETRPSGSVPSSEPAPVPAESVPVEPVPAQSVPAPPAETVPAPPTETVVAEETVTVRRSPRYRNFMILGGVVGAALALLLTLVYPPNDRFDPVQVFGFLLLGGVAVGIALSCLVAIILDRIVGRRATTVVVDRLGATSTNALEAPDPGSDPQPSRENS